MGQSRYRGSMTGKSPPENSAQLAVRRLTEMIQEASRQKSHGTFSIELQITAGVIQVVRRRIDTTEK